MWFLLLHITFKKTYPMPSLTWHHISFFFRQERQWCFCSSVTSCLQWKDTFPFYSGYLHATFFAFQISAILQIFACSQVEMSQGYPHIFLLFFGYAGTFKAIARIIDVLSVCPRGEGADYARNKADCLSTCKFLLSFFSWFLFLCSHSTCSFFFPSRSLWLSFLVVYYSRSAEY